MVAVCLLLFFPHPCSFCMSLMFSLCCWMSLTVFLVPCSYYMSLTVFHACWVSLTVFQIPGSCCVSLTVSYDGLVSLCLYGLMKLLYVSHTLLLLLADSYSFSKSHGVAACVSFSPMVVGYLSLSLWSHVVATCLSLSLPVP